MEGLKVIISGGGTGGHIYPAIAIADELKLRFPSIELLFVGARGKMEMEKVPQSGYRITGLWITGFQRRSILKNILFPLKLITSLIHSFFILSAFKPHVVIGTGGFASGPLLKMATIKKIPTLIQEQNSYPGITNKLLAKSVQMICVAYEGLEAFFPANKIILTGNPIRQDLSDLPSKRLEALSVFQLSNNQQTLLVLGGSLGARRINQLIEQHLLLFKANAIQVIWQCGELYFNDYQKYNRLDGVQVHKFLNRMDLAYAGADFILSRAGASSVSELCKVGKPVIFVPSPNVAEDHQTKNAKAIADKNAALLIKENNLDRDFESMFLELITTKSLRTNLSKNIASLSKNTASIAIVDEIEKLIKV